MDQATNPDDLLAKRLAGDAIASVRKEALREELRRKISDNVDWDFRRVVEEVAKFLKGKPELEVVAAFAALPGEVDLRSLTEEVGRRWVFPRVTGKELVFYEVGNYREDMVKGAFGIMEPRDELVAVGVREIDLFLCPGLGFDTRGGRIGRGRGFYDRTLGQARKDAVKMGVCFGQQIVEEVEMEAHDVRMNGVIAG